MAAERAAAATADAKGAAWLVAAALLFTVAPAPPASAGAASARGISSLPGRKASMRKSVMVKPAYSSGAIGRSLRQIGRAHV